MPLRLIQITLPAERKKTLTNIADNYDAVDSWWTPKNEDGMRTVTILVNRQSQQDILDSIQNNLQDIDNWRAVLLPVEATLPKEAATIDEPKQKISWRKSLSREELYEEVASGANATPVYFMMVLLSTIVAAVGLIQNNMAFVIAAMVIAPLLNPNLALAFGTSLGDRDLILNALKTTISGLMVAIIPCIALPYLIDIDLSSDQLMERTAITYPTILVALASGAAAVLSMTTGVSSALVGVMVSVALLPPAAALGLFIGLNEWHYAQGSALLLLANLVCIGLSSQAVLTMMGIRPRTFFEQKKANQSKWLQAAICMILLAVITAIIFFSDTGVTDGLKV